MIQTDAPKYKTGIVFSGGGTKAAAHCGALQALEEFGIKADVMAGTSAGSMVAAFYSAGFSPVEMIDLFIGMNFFKDIVTPSAPKGGFFDSKPLVKYIREVMPYKNIEDLPIPVFIAASDMDHGKTVIFSQGELAPRLVASCSIPVVFQPMVIDGTHYIDGGVFMNLPVPAIRSMCEKVIALSVRKVGPVPYRDNVMHVASRAYEMMFMANIIEDARLADHYIELETTNYSVYDISNVEKLFLIGYKNACESLERQGFRRVKEKQPVTFAKHNRLSPFQKYYANVLKALEKIKNIK